MPSPTTATLTGPTFGLCGIPTTDYTVTLDHPADPGGVVVTVSSSVGGDTITSSPFTIPAGQTTGTFTVTTSSPGTRNINISTAPALTYAGIPKSCFSFSNCPDDAGTVNQAIGWTPGASSCPPTFSKDFSMTPPSFLIFALQMYCTTGTLSLTITE